MSLAKTQYTELSTNGAWLTSAFSAALCRGSGSVRSYKSDPVPDSWVDAIIAAGQRAPTSSNVQAYSIVVVRNGDSKAKLAGNQQHIVQCPVFFAICADLTRPAYACEMHRKDFVGHTMEKGLVASIDAALVGMSMSLAADSMGLGTVMIGGMRNAPLEVAALLKLPKRVYVIFGLCLGWPVAAPAPKPRQPMAAMVPGSSTTPLGRKPPWWARMRNWRGMIPVKAAKPPPRPGPAPLRTIFSSPGMKLPEQLRTLGFDFE